MRAPVVAKSLLAMALLTGAAPSGANPSPAPAGASGSAAAADPPVVSTAPLTVAREFGALLERSGTLSTPDALAAWLDEARALGPRLAPSAKAHLLRTHGTTVDARRAVLRRVKASVPDGTGKFETPGRQREAQIRADDAFDWLPPLLALEASEPAVREVVADVLTLRALATSHDPAAAQVIFDAGFLPSTMIYRDECGRRLRAMQPYSVPALTRESKAEGKGRSVDRIRYATYQLERIDRQDADKALTAAAADEALAREILAAFRDTRHREAVYAVFRRLDVDAPRLRAAAREAWLAYVTGPPPPPPRMRHLALPGGKFERKATPIELTYRQLAEEKLRQAAGEILGEVLADDAPIDVEGTSRRLFAFFDQRRGTAARAELAGGLERARTGDLSGAVATFDRLLAVDPDRPDRAEMAPTYLARARELAAAQDWPAAAAAFAKAHGLAPDGSDATEALAHHHLAVGRALVAAGGDGTAEFKLAQALLPRDEAVAKAAPASAPSGRWMLYAGVGAGGAALLLLLAALLRRRGA